jgi:hypothetical protein
MATMQFVSVATQQFYREESEDSKASICSLAYVFRRAQSLYNRWLRRLSFDIHPFSVFRRFLRARLQHLTQGTGGLILTLNQTFSRPTCSSFRLDDFSAQTLSRNLTYRLTVIVGCRTDRDGSAMKQPILCGLLFILLSLCSGVFGSGAAEYGVGFNLALDYG